MLTRRQWLGSVAVLGKVQAQSQDTPRYLEWNEAAESIAALPGAPKPAAWPAFIRRVDREVEDRVRRGMEDSVSQVLLFGTAHTGLPRLRNSESAVSRTGELTAPGAARLKALASALTGEARSERLRLAQVSLGLAGKTEGDIESILRNNLLRFVREEDQADPQRGLSVDASLLPDYAVQQALAALPRARVQRMRRIAIIGPGFDVVDRKYGYDFYPLQTLQPYAVMEAAARLELARLDDLRVTAFDVNPGVLDLLTRVAEEGRAGKPRLMALLGDPANWTPALTDYWRGFGDLTGRPVNDWFGSKAPRGLELRTIAIRPEVVASLEARRLNIVAQTVGPVFDLVVATNILSYYEPLLEALAVSSIARMLKTGGWFITNNRMTAPLSPGLEPVTSRRLMYTKAGDLTEEVLVYRRR